ncbi:SGNH/GDSL hydrolase family protein [Streptomyces sp. AC495_CC817]|uniref:SGNH/GDSL hydrolase family protein n=1 Tax=Streptomyces sp. AC495_CC817 TaxID=2823900 RepID=UPI001C25C205|nr:SGNH/GDSL hydrolase family protein [Streptomyces sp. AC495_CC817]
MTQLYKWSGDDVGGFDTEPTALNPSFTYDTDGDNASLLFTPTGTAFMGKTPLGSPANLSGRFAIKLSAYPSASNPILAPLTSGGTSAWRIRLSSTGTLIVDNTSNTAVGTSAAIPLNTWVLVKFLATATTFTLRIYNAKRGGSQIGTDVAATSTFGLADNLRIGQASSTPVIPAYRIDDILITNDATWAPDPVAPGAIGSPVIGVIGDSNTAGQGANGSYYFDAFTSAGISTRSVYFWGVGGKRIAAADLTGKTSAQNIQDAKNQFGAVSTWVVALGTNDRPQTDATVNAAIDTILTAIGSGPKVIWIGLTSKGSASADDVRLNGLIQAKLASRPNSVFADWNTYIRAIDGGNVASTLWSPDDTTHMSPTGYPVRAQYVASLLAPTSTQPWDRAYFGSTLLSAVYAGATKIWP